ncbi:polysaccharide biosynthesis tyrosine autokinase [Phocaeicola plebeius]|uniref:GumC family protein n=1 Tax=Phocaeicola plebeius TaxID=310297 RepID=UPI000E4C62BA|nr:polysaccharide biosynthesis tyrosine autokinase [Phocaeicola plebeius]RHJ66868.1 tyrosine protein kinase [Phocaeicola plebeius]
MSDERYENGFQPEDEKPVDYKALFFEYLMYWPWILGCVIVMGIVMYAYLRYQAPVYNVNATVLIKQGDQTKNPSASPMQAMQDLGMLSMASNFDNEVEILRSRTLVKKVVNKLNLYINYKEAQTFRYPTDLYKTSPVQVWTTPEEADRLFGPVTLEMTCTPDGKVDVEASYYPDRDADEVTLHKHFDQLPGVLTTPVGVFTLSANSDSILAKIDQTRTITATVVSPTAVATSYTASLSSEPTSKTTTIVALNLQNSNPRRGIDFINMLVALYNEDANNDKNEVAAKTAQFIDDRIGIINQELGTTESQLASFKQQAGLTDLSSDAQLALKENSAYQQKQAENATQIRLITFLKSYINDPKNEMEVIPANVGLADQGLSDLIIKYNDLLIERKRLLRTSNESNPAVVQLDAGIRATRANVQTTVDNVEKGLLITQSDLDREGKKYATRISNAPTQEKELMSITRQQEIKASLYLLLLQKREENAITLASTATNGRIIEEAMAGSTPVSPNKKMFYLIALILGIGIPVGVIYLRNLLRFKIEGRADVEKITDVPVVGDVPMVDTKGNPIVVHENHNDLMEEVFRSVRTNIQYMLQEGQKVILFTSTSSGEGKSFTAGNLACSFAFMGKRVVIVGLDIRKPGLNKVFQISHKEKGITQYLADPEHTDLLSLCQPSTVSSNLYILPGGTVPPNPTELVARKTLDQAIEILKANFDYVVLDTAPIGMVTDTQLIARVADLSVYVCRASYTHKSHYELINELKKDHKLPNLCTLINCIDMNQRKNGYYYGYGKYGKYGKYGYGKKYGYGYGYGYGNKNDK